MTDFLPVHQAVEMENLEALRDLLDAGADIYQEHGGLTLLHHSIDIEIDNHVQTGDPLHVDTTAYLLARGADPRRRSGQGTGVSAEHIALVRGHWLATVLIEEWVRLHQEMH